MASLSLRFFNSFQAIIDNQPIRNYRSSKVQGLLVYLALGAERAHSREVLATLCWPEESDKVAKKNLRQSLYQLRFVLGDKERKDNAFLSINRHTVQFNQASDYQLDVHLFLDAMAKGDLETAVSHYSGELLPGFTCDSLGFEEWLRQERERLHRLALDALYDLTEQRLAQGAEAQAAAQDSAQRQLTLEPWREEAHRQLMQALALAGNRSAALAQYEICKDVLAEELGVLPAPETNTLYEAIRSGSLPPRQPLTEPQADSIAHNLPRLNAPFVGRETEINEITHLLLSPTVPLATIVGPGGMGKSSLAIEAARLLLESSDNSQPAPFPDGAFFVSLAHLEHAHHIPTAIADALGYRYHEREDPTKQLLHYLSQKSMLLILDNFEHLINGVDLIPQLLSAAPKIQLCVTSRQRLQLSSETVFQIGGLDYATDPETMTLSSAAHLFSQCTRQILYDFELNEETLPHVTRICRLVHGMPLGIVLAASWVDTLSLPEIAAEIQRDIDFLETELRDTPDRQRSMRATFSYSWQLLNENERQLFAQLSVFRGGFTREAAKAVTGTPLRPLARLVSKTLLQYDPSLDRYQVHELLRQFGAEKLRQEYSEKSTKTTHSLYYLQAIAAEEATLRGGNPKETLANVTADYENVRTAWRWAVAHNQIDIIGQAAEGLYRFHLAHSLFENGERIMGLAAKQMSRADSKEAIIVHGRLLAYQGMLLFLLGKSQAGVTLLEQSVNILRDKNEEAAMIVPLNHLAYVVFCADEYEKAQELCQASLALSRTHHDPYSQAFSHRTLGGIFRARGNYVAAKGHYENSLRLCRQINDRRGEGKSLNNLGICVRMLDDFVTAGHYYGQARQIYREIGDLSGEANVLNSLGVLIWYQGNYEAAKDLFEQSLHIGEKVGNWQTQSTSLHRIGNYQWNRGHHETAIATYKRVVEMYQQIGDRQSEGYVQDNLGLLYLYRGNSELAEKSSRRVLEIARSIGEPLLEGYGLISLGHALASQNNLPAAAEAYQESLTLWRKLKRPRPTMHPLAGLALIALVQGNLAQAQAYIEDVMAYLVEDNLDGSDEPFRVYGACCQVLLAANDPRAPRFMTATHKRLQAWATKIPDPAARRAFLMDVPFHREIVTAFQQLQTIE